ncbi:MAG TPA: XRE family transcriptional regulator [Candidatus Elarobacter sp.]|jgi:transcriptional regulator with XRE-family HTH domain|nr:XRE family transcriptional regulator [Candidatus Elarobacter sp.]
MPTKSWRQIRRELSPEREAQIQADIEAELARMKLPELRRARQLTQKTVADLLGIAQGDVSKLERRTDAYVATLRNYIEALGGKLRIMAEFPDAEPIEIEGFSTIDSKAATPIVSPRMAAHRRRRIARPR